MTNRSDYPIQLTPKTRDEIREIYADFAPDYRRLNRIPEVLFGIKSLRRQLIRQARGNVLEVACGTGENLAYYPPECTLTLIDYSPDMLALARQEAQKLQIDAALQVMDAQQLDFPDATFDTVVSTLSTCTFPDPIAALREMRRVCRPDGQILLLEHGRSRWKWIARFQDRRAHGHFALAGCRWNQHPPDLLAEAGLKIESHQQRFLGVFHAFVTRP